MHYVNGKLIAWGDWILYCRVSVHSAYWTQAAPQKERESLYRAVCVGLEDWGVQVRADGWMGDAPLMNVDLADIVDVEKCGLVDSSSRHSNDKPYTVYLWLALESVAAEVVVGVCASSTGGACEKVM